NKTDTKTSFLPRFYIAAILCMISSICFNDAPLHFYFLLVLCSCLIVSLLYRHTSTKSTGNLHNKTKYFYINCLLQSLDFMIYNMVKGESDFLYIGIRK